MPDTSIKPGWKTWRFDQIATSVAERVEPGDTDAEYYVGLEHLDTDSLKIRRWGTPSDVEATKLRFRKGDIIFGRRRVYQRKLAVAEFDGICSAHAMVLRPKTDVVLPEFLPFFMQSDLFMTRALEISVGSLSPTINWRTLARQEFVLPPLAEQRRMAGVLNTSKQTLEASLKLIEQSQLLSQAYAKHHLAIHQKQHPPRKVTELTNKITVGIVLKPASWYVPNDEGIPALRSLNVLPGRLEFSDLVHISEEGHQVYQKTQLHPGDIVVVRSGRPGAAAVIPDGIGPLNCIDLVIVTPNENILASYLVAYLNSPYGRQKIAGGTAGTAQKHFNVTAFEKLKVPCPPLEIQESFVNQFSQLRTAQAHSVMRYKNTQQVHQCLLSQLFGG